MWFWCYFRIHKPNRLKWLSCIFDKFASLKWIAKGSTPLCTLYSCIVQRIASTLTLIDRMGHMFCSMLSWTRLGILCRCLSHCKKNTRSETMNMADISSSESMLLSCSSGKHQLETCIWNMVRCMVSNCCLEESKRYHKVHRRKSYSKIWQVGCCQVPRHKFVHCSKREAVN